MEEEEINQNLISFLLKKAKKLTREKRESISTVVKSIKLCPLTLNLEDSLDLIGVNDEIEGFIRDFFSSSIDNYIPREGTLSRKMLLALHRNHPDSLSKPDVLREIGFRPIPLNGFNQQKNFFGSWASMKTLIQHGLVEKSNDRSPKYSLTEKGLQLSNELFGSLEPQRISDKSTSSISLFVSKAEIQCRISFDVKDAIFRTRLEWKEKELPLGSIWFIKDDQVLDFVIQFSSFSAFSNDESIKRKISGSPFSRRVFLIPNKENNINSAELKIKMNLNYEIEAVFAESIALISRYICGVAAQLEKRTNCMLGTFDEVVEKCSEMKYSANVGQVWKEQLKLIPGIGPNFAANISAHFQTPHQLIAALEYEDNPQEKFVDEIYHCYGRRPSQKTTNSILNLFTNVKT